MIHNEWQVENDSANLARKQEKYCEKHMNGILRYDQLKRKKIKIKLKKYNEVISFKCPENDEIVMNKDSNLFASLQQL